jgi:hypothetical protein
MRYNFLMERISFATHVGGGWKWRVRYEKLGERGRIKSGFAPNLLVAWFQARRALRGLKVDTDNK